MKHKCIQSEKLILGGLKKMQTVYSAAIPVNGIQLPGSFHVPLTECFIDVTVILYFIS